MFKKVIVLSMLLIGIVGTSHAFFPFSSYSLFKKTQAQLVDKIEKLEAEIGVVKNNQVNLKAEVGVVKDNQVSLNSEVGVIKENQIKVETKLFSYEKKVYTAYSAARDAISNVNSTTLMVVITVAFVIMFLAIILVIWGFAKIYFKMQENKQLKKDVAYHRGRKEHYRNSLLANSGHYKGTQ